MNQLEINLNVNRSDWRIDFGSDSFKTRVEAFQFKKKEIFLILRITQHSMH